MDISPEKLIDARLKMKWDPKEAALKIGVSQQFLGQIEKGKKQPSRKTLIKIAAAYGVSVESLMGEGGELPSVPRSIAPRGTRRMRKYLASRGTIKANDPLFITRTGAPLERTELLNMIVATAARAGVSHANVHKFRHTFAINFLRNGGNVLGLQRLLGHEKMDTLRIYVELAQMDLANAQAQASPADNWGL